MSRGERLVLTQKSVLYREFLLFRPTKKFLKDVFTLKAPENNVVTGIFLQYFLLLAIISGREKKESQMLVSHLLN